MMSLKVQKEEDMLKFNLVFFAFVSQLMFRLYQYYLFGILSCVSWLGKKTFFREKKVIDVFPLD